MTDSKKESGIQDPEESSSTPQIPNSSSVSAETSAEQISTPLSQAPVVSASESGSGKGLATGALILSVVALGAAGYAWYQTAVNARLAGGEQTSRIAAVEQRFDDVKDAQSGDAATIDQIKQQVANSETMVTDQISQVKQLVGTTESALIGQISDVKQQLATVESTISGQIRDVRSGVAAQQEQIEARITSSEQDLKTQSESFRGEFSSLADSIGEVKNELGTSVEKWSLREIEHLLVVANERLQLGQDPESARRALQIADSRLQEIDNPALLDTRSALSGEIAALTSLESVDVAAVTRNLTLLSNTIGDLPLLGIGDTTGPVKSEPTESESETEGSASEQSASEKVVSIGRGFLADLGSMVQVEKNGKPIAPTITPEIRQLILAKGRLMLEGAQVALVRQQSEVYLERIQATASWIEEHFDTSNDQTTAWLDQLSALEQVSPKVDYPDISGSLAMLRNVIGSGG